MTIFIDDRVGSIEIARYISVPKEIVRLEYGDFSFLGNGSEGPLIIGIERKTISDFVNSIVTGRLATHQLIGLFDSYDIVYLLLEGIYKTTDDGDIKVIKGKKQQKIRLQNRYVTEQMLDNYLNSLAINGIIIKHTNGRMQSGRWLDHIWRWWQKLWNQHKSYKQFLIMPRPASMRYDFRKPSLLHRMVKEFDTVGWDKGRTIAKEYKTMANLVASNERELQKLKGIGPKLAKKIIKGLWEEE